MGTLEDADMYKREVFKYFGNAANTAVKLNIKKSSISQWGEIIPEKRAARLEKITKGKLKYDPSLYMQSA